MKVKITRMCKRDAYYKFRKLIIGRVFETFDVSKWDDGFYYGHFASTEPIYFEKYNEYATDFSFHCVKFAEVKE